MQNKRRKKSCVEESVFALWQLVFGTASLLELWLLLERLIFLLVFVFFYSKSRQNIWSSPRKVRFLLCSCRKPRCLRIQSKPHKIPQFWYQNYLKKKAFTLSSCINSCYDFQRFFKVICYKKIWRWIVKKSECIRYYLSKQCPKKLIVFLSTVYIATCTWRLRPWFIYL